MVSVEAGVLVRVSCTPHAPVHAMLSPQIAAMETAGTR